MKRLAAALVVLAFVGSIVLANWLTSTFGLIPAGFGLMVLAGTYSAGLALGLRDLLHEVSGIPWVVGAIAVGAAVSAVLGDGRIALASAVAFALAELLDLFVYLPLRQKNWRVAVFLSNLAGAVADTLLFLTISGFGLTASSVLGQLVVKGLWVTLSFLLVAEVFRRVVPRKRFVT